MGPYAGVDYNLTLCPLQSRHQHIHHGQPYARVDLNQCQSRLYPPVKDFGFGLSSFVRRLWGETFHSFLPFMSRGDCSSFTHAEKSTICTCCSVYLEQERLDSYSPQRKSTNYTCCSEAEFLDEIQTKVLRVFLLVIHSTSTALTWDFFSSNSRNLLLDTGQERLQRFISAIIDSAIKRPRFFPEKISKCFAYFNVI